MTSLVSVRLDEELLQEMRAKAHLLHLTQTDYIKRAIKFMNRQTEKLARRQRLQRASLRSRKESMRINAEFSEVDHDPEA